MNDLSIENSILMDSREIAEILQTRHSDLIQSIETQLPKVGCTINPYTYKNEQNGQYYKHYLLTERESLIIASGYSVELRAKIIDRWIELENKNKPILPKTFSEALRLAADQAEQIELMKPKAIVYDKFLSSESWQTMNDIAHVIGVGRNRLYQILRDKKILMADNTPYQEYMDRGYFKVIEKPIYMNCQIILKKQTLVNAKGLEYISKLNEKTSVTA